MKERQAEEEGRGFITRVCFTLFFSYLHSGGQGSSMVHPAFLRHDRRWSRGGARLVIGEAQGTLA